MHNLTDLNAGKMAGATEVRLNGLNAFPEALYDLADTLETLDLSDGSLTTLPEDLPRLHKLRRIFCSGNLFKALPEVLGACPELQHDRFQGCRVQTVPENALPPQLRWLILTDNAVTHLPGSLGDCSHLQKLMLAGNRLTHLPETMRACHRLELVRLAANRFESLPPWLLSLPRLSWLAFAGNPFADKLEAAALNGLSVDTISWAQLELTEVLGEGASGTIHRARFGDAEVAIKRFKGAVTSDGLPRSEMAACLTAGGHPHLIPVQRRVAGVPDGHEALVMDLIDRRFSVLAGPPSFESCTRDVYAADQRFAVDEAVGIAAGIASAVAHLHSRGLMHGDLYAHNILHDGAGQALIGDFGAASFFDKDDRPTAEALQRLEVRAFGCLLEELTQRCEAPEALKTLATICLDEQPQRRPLFAQIVERLEALAG